MQLVCHFCGDHRSFKIAHVAANSANSANSAFVRVCPSAATMP